MSGHMRCDRRGGTVEKTPSHNPDITARRRKVGRNITARHAIRDALAWRLVRVLDIPPPGASRRAWWTCCGREPVRG